MHLIRGTPPHADWMSWQSMLAPLAESAEKVPWTVCRRLQQPDRASGLDQTSAVPHPQELTQDNKATHTQRSFRGAGSMPTESRWHRKKSAQNCQKACRAINTEGGWEATLGFKTHTHTAISHC